MCMAGLNLLYYYLAGDEYEYHGTKDRLDNPVYTKDDIHIEIELGDGLDL